MNSEIQAAQIAVHNVGLSVHVASLFYPLQSSKPSGSILRLGLLWVVGSAGVSGLVNPHKLQPYSPTNSPRPPAILAA